MASNIEETKTDEVIMTEEIQNEVVEEVVEETVEATEETEVAEVEEERFDRSALTFRAAEVTGSDDKSRRVRMSLSAWKC